MYSSNKKAIKKLQESQKYTLIKTATNV